MTVINWAIGISIGWNRLSVSWLYRLDKTHVDFFRGGRWEYGLWFGLVGFVVTVLTS